MTQQVKIDTEAVRALAELLRETDLTEVEYHIDSLRIKVVRSIPQTVISTHQPSMDSFFRPEPLLTPDTHTFAPSPHPASDVNTCKLEASPGIIEAQMVGTVYLSPGAGSDPFVSVGDTVAQGQTLFIIEAMKVMNMIRAPRSGVVKHVFVKDMQPVEYGDPIITID